MVGQKLLRPRCVVWLGLRQFNCHCMQSRPAMGLLRPEAHAGCQSRCCRFGKLGGMQRASERASPCQHCAETSAPGC